MWHLVRLSLAYHRKVLFWVWVICLVFSKLGLVASVIAGAALLSAEDKERRLLLHLPLPVTRTGVGWARLVFPAMILVLGTAVAVVVIVVLGIAVAAFSSGELFARSGAPTVAEAASELLLFATILMFFLQLLLMAEEIQVWTEGRFLRTLMGGAALLLLLGFSFLAWVAMAQFGSYWVMALGIAGLSLGLMALTVFLFQRRPSFTGG